jgi:DNA-directed RNA polymerase subunit E'/Rpb7
MTMMRKLGVSSIVGIIQLAVAAGMVFPSASAGERERVPIVVSESEDQEIERGSSIRSQIVNISRS